MRHLLTPMCALLCVFAMACDGDSPATDTGGGTDIDAATADTADAPVVCNKLIQRVCNPDDPENVYWSDTCGGLHSVVTDCNFGRVCTDDDGPGGKDATCKDPVIPCDPTNDVVCDSKKEGALFAIDVCDQKTEMSECSDGQVCKDIDGDGGVDAVCAQAGCNKVLDRVCDDTGAPESIYWADSCGGFHSVVVECKFGRICADSDGPGGADAICKKPVIPCEPTSDVVCSSDNPSVLFAIDTCGDETPTVACAQDEVCTDDDGTGGTIAACGPAPPPACYKTLNRICDPAEPTTVYWLDSCGGPDSVATTCKFGQVCSDIDGIGGNAATCKFPPPSCDPTDDIVCNPADPTSLYNITTCGDFDGVAAPCTSGDLCADNDGNGGSPATCVTPCLPSNDIVCSASSTSALYNVDDCGTVTGVASVCGPQQACTDGDGAGGLPAICVSTCAPTGETVCNPADPGSIFEVDSCGAFTAVVASCTSEEICSDSDGPGGAAPSCELLCAPSSDIVCSSLNSAALFGVDDCGNVTGTTADCASGEICTDTDGDGGADATCELDCVATEDLVCDASDDAALFNINVCGTVVGVAISCAANEACEDSDGTGGTPAACVSTCTPTSDLACDPANADALFALDSCGNVTGQDTTCGANEICADDGSGASCVSNCVVTGQVTCGNDTSETYFLDSCGAVTTVAFSCDVNEACADPDGAGGANAACESTCVASGEITCDALPTLLYAVDTCGTVTGVASVCGANEACNDSDGIGGADATCVSTCIATSDLACGQDSTALYSLDSCGNTIGVSTTCGVNEACSDPDGPGNTDANCNSTCAATATVICSSSDGGATYLESTCGGTFGVLANCGTNEACADPDGDGGDNAACVSTCVPTTTLICDASDSAAIFVASTCGGPDDVYTLCDTDFACEDADGDGGADATCVSTVPPCLPTGDLACNPDDLTSLYFVDTCDNFVSVGVTCGEGEFCDDLIIGASDATCECVETTQLGCRTSGIDGTYVVDSCGEVTNERVETCPSGTDCEDPDGPGGQDATCVQQCTKLLASACNPSDPTKVYWLDTCGGFHSVKSTCSNDWVCTPSGGGSTCAPPCAPAQSVKSCSEDNSAVVWLDGCGNPASVFDACDGHEICDAGVCVDNCGDIGEGRCKNTTPISLPGDSSILETDNCGELTGNVQETCIYGEFCSDKVGPPQCISSMTDTTSPHFVKACTFLDFIKTPTDLAMDCRCRRSLGSIPTATTGGILNCWPTNSAFGQGIQAGTGPSLFHLNSFVRGGVISKPHNEFFVAHGYTDNNHSHGGLVVAYNYDTGNRRIVSGKYPDPASGYVEYGSGYRTNRIVGVFDLEDTVHPFITDIDMGSDGMLYVYSTDTGPNSEIVKVDPTSGARTLVWKRQRESDIVSPFGQCFTTRPKGTYPGGFVPQQISPRTYALDPTTLKHYIGFRHIDDGVGIMEISADGTECNLVTRFAGNFPAIGTGYGTQYQPIAGMMVRNGNVYFVLEFDKALVEVDIATGNRTAISVGDGSLGSGDTGMGQNNIFWDDTRDLIWTMGSPATFFGMVVDPATGQRQSPYKTENDALLPNGYPVERGTLGSINNGNTIGYGAAALHPDDNDRLLLMGVDGEMHELELSTQNNWIKSI